MRYRIDSYGNHYRISSSSTRVGHNPYYTTWTHLSLINIPRAFWKFTANQHHYGMPGKTAIFRIKENAERVLAALAILSEA